MLHKPNKLRLTALSIALVAMVGLAAFKYTTPRTIATTGNSYALVIGINEYNGGEWLPLKTPVNDATSLGKILKDKYGFKEVLTLANKDATRERIIDYLDRISSNVAEDDNLLIFFSGHGIEIGTEGYWVPADATSQDRFQLIPNSEVRNALSKTKSKHVLVFVDACFSSTIFKSSNLFLKNDGTEDYYEKVDELISRQAITAGGLEPVPDGSDEHSVFTKYLLRYLEKNEKPAMDASELFELMRYPVAANSPNTPQFGHIQNTGHEGGQFVFRIAEEKACDFQGVKMQEGGAVVFNEMGGTLHATSPEKNLTYQWLKGTTPLDETGATLNVKDKGTYTVIVTSADGTCTDAAVVEVDIKLPDILVAIEEGDMVDFTHKGVLHAQATSEKYKLEFEWRKNNFIIGNTKDITVTETGLYSVTVKLSDGRVLSSAKTNVTVKDRRYEVKIGDNMERIAQKFYGDPAKAGLIYEANPTLVKPGDILMVGTVLVIPPDEKTLTAAGQLKIGAFDKFAPFSQVGMYNDGMLTEIVRRTFEEAKQDVFVDFMAGNKAKAGAFSGRLMAAFPVPMNEQDQAMFLFSEPLYKVLNVFFVEANSKLIFEKEKDIKGITVAVVRGFQSNRLTDLAQRKIVGITAFETAEECFAALKAGNAQAVAIPQMTGLMVLKNSKTFDEIDFKMLPQLLESNTLHLVVSKEYPNANLLMDSFNNAFKTLSDKGVINQILNSHIDRFQSGQ